MKPRKKIIEEWEEHQRVGNTITDNRSFKLILEVLLDIRDCNKKRKRK